MYSECSVLCVYYVRVRKMCITQVDGIYYQWVWYVSSGSLAVRRFAHFPIHLFQSEWRTHEINWRNKLNKWKVCWTIKHQLGLWTYGDSNDSNDWLDNLHIKQLLSLRLLTKKICNAARPVLPIHTINMYQHIQCSMFDVQCSTLNKAI